METIHPSATSKLVLFHQVVHIPYRVEFMFTGSAEQGSCSQEVQSTVHVHKKCRVGFMFTVQSSVHIHDQYGVVFMFTKSMEYTISVHEQKECIVQFMFTNRFNCSDMFTRSSSKQYSCSLILCWSETELSKISEHNCNFFMFQKCIYIGLSSNVCSSI